MIFYFTIIFELTLWDLADNPKRYITGRMVRFAHIQDGFSQ